MASPVHYDVDSEALLDEEVSRVAPTPGQAGPSISVSASPFHVPVGVEIAATVDDTCTITFVYPNEESPERGWRVVPGDPELHVRLGRYPGKILQIHFRSALARLRVGPIRLEPSAAETWGSSSVRRRNATIIAAILAQMPDSVRENVIRDLGSATP